MTNEGAGGIGAAAGHDPAMTDTAAVINQFNAAFLERVFENLIDLLALDCVIEGTGPAPTADVWTGYDECLVGWQGFASAPRSSSRSNTSTSTATQPPSAGGS